QADRAGRVGCAAGSTGSIASRSVSEGGRVADQGWLRLAADEPFGVQTLPYGVLETVGPAVRIGDRALPLRAATEALLPEHAGLFGADTLDPFLAAGPAVWHAVRSALTGWFTDEQHRSRI